MKTDLHDLERALFLFLLAKGCVSLSRLVAYLQGMDDTAVILPVHYLIMFRVQSFQVFTECFKSLLFVASLHLLTDVLTDGRNIVDAIAYGINIHHAATCQELDRGVLELFVQQLQHFLFIHGRIIIIVNTDAAHEKVLDSLQLLLCRCCRPDTQFPVDLPGVRIDDGNAEALCDIDAKFRLSNGCRSRNDDECVQQSVI